MRAVVLATLATLVGLALAGTPAAAQNAWLASKMIEGMCGAKAAPGGSVDRLAERLNLTDAQKATLKDLKDAAAASAASTRTALCDVKPDLTTAPSRLAFSEKVTQAQLDGMKAIEPSFRRSTPASTTNRSTPSTPAVGWVACSVG
jgi:hypothetical protein